MRPAPLLDHRRVVAGSSPNNAIDNVHRNPVEISDLSNRHPIRNQGPNAIVLRSRYLGRSSAHRSSASRFRIGRWCDDLVSHRHRHGHGDDARCSRCGLLDLRRRNEGRCRLFGTLNLLLRRKESVGGFASFVELLAIVTGVRRLPVVRQGASPDVLGRWRDRIWCFAKNT